MPDLYRFLGILLICRQAAVWLASQEKKKKINKNQQKTKTPGIPNYPTNLEIWNILPMAQKTSLSYATCLFFWLFVFVFFEVFCANIPKCYSPKRHLTTHTASNRTNICYVLVVKVLKTIRYEI